MTFWELMVIAVGLSMDAFAVAMCKGLSMRRINYGHAVIIALSFGVFQALMPLIGWALGIQFSTYIENFDHWIAFVLLAFIGIKMIKEAFEDGDCDENDCKISNFDIKELIILSVATSIDALAAGISFACLNVDILPSCASIGLTTFVICVAGVLLGNKFGAKYKNKAEIFGGVILVLIGIKILLEHLGILNF